MPDTLAAQSSKSNSSRSVLRGWLGLFVASFLLYAATASRGAQWQDSGNFILRIVTGELLNPLGIALSHPLHYWLGRLAIRLDMLEPCFAITLLSSLAAAIAVANIYGCVYSLTGRWSAAMFAAASLAVANTFWQLATITETYTLTAALFSAECWCLIVYAKSRSRSWLWLMLLLNGLGIANHVQASLTTPVLAVIVIHSLWQKQLTLKEVAIGCGLWLVGTLPYSLLIVAEWGRTGALAATIHSALFGTRFAGNVLNLTLSPRILAVGLGFPIFNFPNLLLPVAVYGLIRADRIGAGGLIRRALLAGLILHMCFVLRYNVVDQHTFFLPVYVLLAIFGGIGAAAFFQWSRSKKQRNIWIMGLVLLAATPMVYFVATTVARKYDLLQSVVRNKPYRDDYTYLLLPWSINEHSAEQMSSEALRLAGPDGLIISEDHMATFAVRYQALRAKWDQLDIQEYSKHGLTALEQRIRKAAAEGRSVVLVPWDVDQPRWTPPIGTWQRHGDLYVLDTTMIAGPRIPSRSF